MERGRKRGIWRSRGGEGNKSDSTRAPISGEMDATSYWRRIWNGEERWIQEAREVEWKLRKGRSFNCSWALKVKSFEVGNREREGMVVKRAGARQRSQAVKSWRIGRKRGVSGWRDTVKNVATGDDVSEIISEIRFSWIPNRLHENYLNIGHTKWNITSFLFFRKLPTGWGHMTSVKSQIYIKAYNMATSDFFWLPICLSACFYCLSDSHFIYNNKICIHDTNSRVTCLHTNFWRDLQGNVHSPTLNLMVS